MKLEEVHTYLQGGGNCLVDSARVDPSILPPTKAVAEPLMISGDGGEKSDDERECSGPFWPKGRGEQEGSLSATMLSAMITGVWVCSAVVALANGREQGIRTNSPFSVLCLSLISASRGVSYASTTLSTSMISPCCMLRPSSKHDMISACCSI